MAEIEHKCPKCDVKIYPLDKESFLYYCVLCEDEITLSPPKEEKKKAGISNPVKRSKRTSEENQALQDDRVDVFEVIEKKKKAKEKIPTEPLKLKKDLFIDGKDEELFDISSEDEDFLSSSHRKQKEVDSKELQLRLDEKKARLKKEFHKTLKEEKNLDTPRTSKALTFVAILLLGLLIAGIAMVSKTLQATPDGTENTVTNVVNSVENYIAHESDEKKAVQFATDFLNAKTLEEAMSMSLQDPNLKASMEKYWQPLDEKIVSISRASMVLHQKDNTEYAFQYLYIKLPRGKNKLGLVIMDPSRNMKFDWRTYANVDDLKLTDLTEKTEVPLKIRAMVQGSNYYNFGYTEDLHQAYYLYLPDANTVINDPMIAFSDKQVAEEVRIKSDNTGVLFLEVIHNGKTIEIKKCISAEPSAYVFKNNATWDVTERESE